MDTDKDYFHFGDIYNPLSMYFRDNFHINNNNNNNNNTNSTTNTQPNTNESLSFCEFCDVLLYYCCCCCFIYE
jgi:hypothetical protein